MFFLFLGFVTAVCEIVYEDLIESNHEIVYTFILEFPNF